MIFGAISVVGIGGRVLFPSWKRDGTNEGGERRGGDTRIGGNLIRRIIQTQGEFIFRPVQRRTDHT